MDKTQAAANHTQAMIDVSQHSIYLMGASFILGSLVTVMLLLVLDFVRRNKAGAQ